MASNNYTCDKLLTFNDVVTVVNKYKESKTWHQKIAEIFTGYSQMKMQMRQTRSFSWYPLNQ